MSRGPVLGIRSSGSDGGLLVIPGIASSP